MSIIVYAIASAYSLISCNTYDEQCKRIAYVWVTYRSKLYLQHQADQGSGNAAYIDPRSIVLSIIPSCHLATRDFYLSYKPLNNTVFTHSLYVTQW